MLKFDFCVSAVEYGRDFKTLIHSYDVHQRMTFTPRLTKVFAQAAGFHTITPLIMVKFQHAENLFKNLVGIGQSLESISTISTCEARNGRVLGA